jgi:hypothetical protein
MFDFTDPNWRPYHYDTNKRLGVAPNELWSNAITREGAVVVNQSTRHDDSWALGVAGFERTREASEQQRVSAAYVVLARRNQQEEREVVIQKSVAAVAAALQGVPPRVPKDPGLGPYWWMRADLTPYPTRTVNRQLPHDDTPF